MPYTPSNGGPTSQRDAARRKAQSQFAAHDARTALVKEIVAKEAAASNAKTAKLRALRLSKEEADRRAAAAAPPAPAKAPKAAPKPRRKTIRG